MTAKEDQPNNIRPKYYRETTIDYIGKNELILIPEKIDFFVDHPEADLLANPQVPDKLVFLKEDREKKFPNRYKDMPDTLPFLSNDPKQLVETKLPPTQQNKQIENFESNYNRKSLTEAAIKAQLQMEAPGKMTFFSSHMQPTESQYFGNPENPVSKPINRKSLTEAALRAQLNQQPQDKVAFFGNASQVPTYDKNRKSIPLVQFKAQPNPVNTFFNSQSQASAVETSQLGNPRVNRKSLAEAELRAQLNPELPDKINFFGNSTFETTQLENTQVNRKSLNEAQLKAQLNQQPQDKMTFFGNSIQSPAYDGNRKSIPKADLMTQDNIDKVVEFKAPGFETSHLGNPKVNRKSLAEAELRAQLNPEQPDKITFFENSTFDTAHITNTQINRKSLNEAQLKAQLNQQPQDKMAFFGKPPQAPPQQDFELGTEQTEAALRAQLRKQPKDKTAVYDRNERVDRKSLTEAAIKAQLNQKAHEKMSFFSEHRAAHGNPKTQKSKNRTELKAKRNTEAELKAQVRAQTHIVASSRMNIFDNQSYSQPLRAQTKPTNDEAREIRKQRNAGPIDDKKHGQKDFLTSENNFNNGVIQIYNVEVVKNNRTAKPSGRNSKVQKNVYGFDNDFISASHADFVTAHRKLDQKLPRRHGKEDPDGFITPSFVGSGSHELSSISTFNLLRDGSSVPSADVSEFERFSGGSTKNSHTGIDLSTLKLNNLDDRVGYQELHNLFPKSISLATSSAKDRHGKKKKRYTFVIFESVSDAAKAMEKVNGKILYGLPLHLEYRRFSV